MATSEFAPFVRVGGLAYATAGLVHALSGAGVDVTVVVPDYGTFDADFGPAEPLDMPDWVGITTLRRGTCAGDVPLIAVRPPGMDRPHPYTDTNGQGWPDNDFRFMAFSAAIARVSADLEPDVLHLNDWHTGAALGFLEGHIPASVFTIHNLAYQGQADPVWLAVMNREATAYEWFGTTNPMSGAIALADVVVTVSPNYAEEIRHPSVGEGLDGALRARGDRLVGIRNGIDVADWNPADDPHIPVPYSAGDLAGKKSARTALLGEAGWGPERSPIVGIVTRLTGQKGIDLALDVVPYLGGIPMRMMVVGSGDRHLADAVHASAAAHPDQLWFFEGFDEPLAHRVFAGSDLLLMPSRFEPCGLAQMQAMNYGTIPVVTDVGGLHDTVIDGDRDPENGTGFIARDPSPTSILDALHRAGRAWRSHPRRRKLQLNGMKADWSWTTPAANQIEVYRQAIAAHAAL